MPARKRRKPSAARPTPPVWLPNVYIRALDGHISRLGWVTTAEVRRIGPAWRRLLAYVREHPERYTSVLRRVEGRRGWTQTWQMRTESTDTVIYGTVRAERPGE